MADQTSEINETFHCAECPDGIIQFEPGSYLDAEQQTKLNALRVTTMRNNAKYLAEHPEISVLIQMLMDSILRDQPRESLQVYASKFFSQSKFVLNYQMAQELEKKGLGPKPVRDSKDSTDVKAPGCWDASVTKDILLPSYPPIERESVRLSFRRDMDLFAGFRSPVSAQSPQMSQDTFMLKRIIADNNEQKDKYGLRGSLSFFTKKRVSIRTPPLSSSEIFNYYT